MTGQTIQSDTHELRWRDWGFDVHEKAPRQTHTVEYRGGEKVVDKTEVAPPQLQGSPLFRAAYEGDGQWDIDLDCGFQRWNGPKEDHEVAGALLRCGFDGGAVDAIMEQARNLAGGSCPRVF